MYYYGTPPQWLVVAAPDEPLGPALTEALRQQGWVAFLATTPEQTSAAASYAATFVILSPAGQTHPTLQAVLRMYPARLIPILTAPLDLPAAAWASAPLTAQDDPAATARAALAVALGQPPAPPSTTIPSAMPPAASSIAPPELTPPLAVAGAPTSTATSNPRAASRLPSILGIISIVLVISFITASIAVLIIHLPATQPQGPYAATAPGPGCDHGNGQWSGDASLTVTCDVAGTMLSTSHATGNIQGITFQPPSQKIPLSYRVSIHGAILNGTDETAMVVGVHRGLQGAQDFIIQANRLWAIAREDAFGAFSNNLSTGFLPATVDAKDIDITVEVDGAVLRFSLDGQVVTTITDASLLGSEDILLGAYDANAFTVRFSDFAYTPLPDPSLNLAGALATATAQTQQRDQTPYHAQIPGYGCDMGGAQWSPIDIGNLAGISLACTPKGMQITQKMKNGYLGSEYFYWVDGNFLENYMVSSTVTFPATTSVCADLLTRVQGLRNYSFEVCRDGQWTIGKYDASGGFTALANGNIAKAATYTIAATLQGTQQTLTINGKILSTTRDPDYSTTNYLTLAIDTVRSNGVGTVVFSNFTFTPMP